MSKALGKSLINSKAKSKKLRKRHEGAEWDNINKKNKSAVVQSVTDETSLDEFLAKAQLAGTEFTAERSHAKIVSSETREFLGVLTPSEIAARRKLHKENEERLKIPRRPEWNPGMTAKELDAQETAAFLDWRRQVAEVQETTGGLVMTPFERNLQLWRQLWRVLERSHVIAQIVDARNPLMFRSEDLECYVRDLDGKKQNLLILNKADLLTQKQRVAWAEYFEFIGVRAVFWSAIEQNLQGEKDSNGEIPSDSEESETHFSSDEDTSDSDKEADETAHERTSHPPEKTLGADENLLDEVPKGKILSTSKLLNHLQSLTEEIEGQAVIGMVGYPNVGKSSTINQILGSKKVAVSITPGKTKHFQTQSIDDTLMLCDCPGLVMPSFALSREEMIVNGILPVNQTRGSANPPVALLCSRFPRGVFEQAYGVVLPTPPDGREEPYPSPHELLTSVAFSRGFMSSKGIPDSSRAGRLILNDVIKGKLTWAAAPPTVEQCDFDDFRWDPTEKKVNEGGIVGLQQLEKRNLLSTKPKTAQMDSAFFENLRRVGLHTKGKRAPQLTGGSATDAKSGKKHFNKNKKEKLRKVYRDLDA